MQKFDITGMSCAACSARVEKAVKGVGGVNSCAVNLLTNSMTVEGAAKTEDIIAAVAAAGYGASVAGQKNTAGGFLLRFVFLSRLCIFRWGTLC